MVLDTKLYDSADVLNIAGGNESKLKIISNYYNINITISGNDIICSNVSDEIKEELEKLFTFLITVSKHSVITMQDITYILKMKDDYKSLEELYLNRKVILTNYYGKPIYPKTINQVKYIDLINDNDIVFSTGKAGSGKTFLSIVLAVKMLKKERLRRLF